MSTSTSRIALVKPAGPENIDVSILNSNADKIDSFINFAPVTSATRPAAPYNGQAIRETDTGKHYVHNGGVPASANWVQILDGGHNLDLSSTVVITVGSGSSNLYRSAANVLKTDGSLVVAVNATVSGSAAVTGALTAGGNVTVSGSSGNQFLIGTSVVGPRALWVEKTTTQSVTSSTTQVNDTVLALALGVGTWEVRLTANATGAAAGDIDTSWTFSGTATTNGRSCIGPTLGNADVTNTAMRSSGAAGLATIISYGLIASTSRIEESFILTVTVAGTLNFRWAQDVSSATATNVTAGSRLVAVPLA